MHEITVILLVIGFSVGGGLFFTGYMVSLTTALGNNVPWGLAVLLVPPLALIYSFINRSRIRYAFRFMVVGIVLMAIFGPAVYYSLDLEDTVPMPPGVYNPVPVN